MTSERNLEVKDETDKVGTREKWTNKLDFIFSCIGYAIGKPNLNFVFLIK